MGCSLKASQGCGIADDNAAYNNGFHKSHDGSVSGRCFVSMLMGNGNECRPTASLSHVEITEPCKKRHEPKRAPRSLLRAKLHRMLEGVRLISSRRPLNLSNKLPFVGIPIASNLLLGNRSKCAPAFLPVPMFCSSSFFLVALISAQGPVSPPRCSVDNSLFTNATVVKLTDGKQDRYYTCMCVNR